MPNNDYVILGSCHTSLGIIRNKPTTTNFLSLLIILLFIITLPSTNASILTNTTIANSELRNDSSVCHPILLEMGAESQYGLCDDQTPSKALAGIFLGLHTILEILSLGGLSYKLWKLKKTTNREANFLTMTRNPLLMVLGSLVGYIYSIIMMVRILIGRKIFPCFLFMFCFYMAVPGLASTIIVRCLRTITLSRMNELKVKIGNRELKDLDTTSTKNVELNVMNSSMNDGISSTTDTSQGGESHVSQTNVSFSMSNVTGATVSNSLESTNQIQVTLEDSVSVNQVRTTKWENFEKKVLMKVYKFLISTKFVVLWYSIIAIVHIGIYIIIGAVDYVNYDKNIALSYAEKKSSSFVYDTRIFTTNGCGISFNSVLIIVAYLIFYGSFAIVIIGYSFLIKRDIWRVKIELYIIVICWILLIILYAVFSIIDVLSTLVDYYFPTFLFVLIGCMIDTFMSVTVPVFFYQKTTIDNRYSQSSRSNILLKCLFNKKWNEEFLLFSEKSYCPENLMCWNAIEQFKRAPDKLRRKLIKVIFETYLLEGSPLELNIQRNLFNNFEDIMAITHTIKKQEDDMKKLVSENNIVVGTIKKRRSMKMILIQPNILDKIQKQCEVNMVDCFDRFYIQYWQDMCKDLEADEN